jgi:hypothetical protein
LVVTKYGREHAAFGVHARQRSANKLLSKGGGKGRNQEYKDGNRHGNATKTDAITVPN